MKISLGIETSCDDTGVAIIGYDSNSGKKTILSNLLKSQLNHKKYGGVVPEVAARAHLDILDFLIKEAMKEANLSFKDLDVICATAGPGLIGSLLVGTMAAKAIAYAHSKPFIAVNHLEAHALTVRFMEDVKFPYLLLLISGGHCQILIVEGVGKYELLGTTQDDASGEVFDKIGRILGLGYPAGAMVEKKAKLGNPNRFLIPVPFKGTKHCNFSFSGLKTALRKTIEQLPKPLSEQDIADVCYALQSSVAQSLADRLKNALSQSQERNITSVVMSGGVAANIFIRSSIENEVNKYNLKLYTPPVSLCTDNGLMVAWAGMEKFILGEVDGLNFAERPRWPLSELSRSN